MEMELHRYALLAKKLSKDPGQDEDAIRTRIQQLYLLLVHHSFTPVAAPGMAILYLPHFVINSLPLLADTHRTAQSAR